MNSIAIYIHKATKDKSTLQVNICYKYYARPILKIIMSEQLLKLWVSGNLKLPTCEKGSIVDLNLTGLSSKNINMPIV